MGSAFTTFHREILDLYASVTTGANAEDVCSQLEHLAAGIRAEKSAAALVTYERYLELIGLWLQDPDLSTQLSVSADDFFDKAFREDPSLPFHIIGLALQQRQQGNWTRARHLLRRLAASRYPERRLARYLLSETLRREAAA